VAYSAGGDTILLMNSAGAFISQYSATFSAVSTLPSGAAIASDKRNNAYFYGGSAGAIYVSSNIGVTFAKTATLGASTVVNQIRVHPTVAGDVWASTDVGLFHSTNFGTTFTQVGSVTAGYSFALGAASTSTAYPVIYGFFTISAVTSLYKTEDSGANWIWITDTAHGFAAASSNYVQADMATYGRVFVGTNGRGIFYGAPSGSLPSPTTTVSSTKVSSTATSSASSVKTTSTTLVTTTSSKAGTTSTTTSTTSVKTTTSTSTAASATGTSTAYGQCGGSNYSGPTLCPAGYTCTVQNSFYSQCT